MEQQDFMNLMELESPFKWEVPEVSDISHDKYIENQIEKFQNSDDENEFKWTKFTIGLLLSYELCEKGNDFKEALSYIQWCKNHLIDLHTSECQESLFSNLFPNLLYVTCVTEAIILLRSGQIRKAYKVMNVGPIELSDRPTIHSPGLSGTKAAFYLQYGHKGHELALEAAKTAKNLNPVQAEWWFIIGNALGRMRRTRNGLITEEEVQAIEKAFALEKNATYTAHLAQVYTDLSSYWLFNRDTRKSKMYAESAVIRYREAINLRPTCVQLKARIVHGMLRIRNRKAMDIPFVKKLLDEVTESTTTNAMVYHDLGYFHERFLKDTDEAIKYLNQSNKLGNIKALIYMINIKWNHGKEDEIIKDLEEGLTRYNSPESVSQLLVYLGACHALIKKNWVTVVKCFQKSLCVDPSAYNLENFNGFNNECVNLLELVANYLHLRVERALETAEQITSFLDEIKKIRPSIYQADTRKSNFREWEDKLIQFKNKNKTPKNIPVCKVQPLPSKK